MAHQESELYLPVKKWLEGRACTVKSEVGALDIMGLYRDETVFAVELKCALNLEVINQAVMRQKVADFVYIAVIHSGRAVRSTRYKRTVGTLKRLNIGLLTVNLEAEPPEVYELTTAEPFDFEKSRSAAVKKRRALVKEFHSRSGDHNTGGVSKRPLVTAYREKALKIALKLLDSDTPVPPKGLAEEGISNASVQQLLSKNYYGWFERVGRGQYQLTQLGREALSEYEAVVNSIRRTME